MNYVKKQFPNTRIRYQHIDYPKYEDVVIEVHFIPTTKNNPVYNRRIQKWVETRIFEGGWKDEIMLPNGEGSICVPSFEFNIIYQLSHLMHHFFDEGIGLRQMIDYYYLLQMRNEKGEMRNEKVAVKREQSHTCMSSAERKQADQRSNEELGMTLRELGLMEIAGAVMWVLGYLVHGERFLDEPSGRAERMVNGCKREEWMICEPDERRGKFLLEEIMEGGNFGIGMKSDIGWLSADSAIGRNILRLKRDARLLRYFPSECLWEPVFRIWHYFWRVGHRLG